MSQVKTLEECSNMELAQLLMRDLWRIYDDGGHSLRSARSQLLEAALWLRESKLYEWAPSYRFCDMIREVESRNAQLELGLETYSRVRPLTELSNYEFICLCIEVAFQVHLSMEDPSRVEELYFVLIRTLLKTDKKGKYDFYHDFFDRNDYLRGQTACI